MRAPYEPAPQFDCFHRWVVIGAPVAMWASNQTELTPPRFAPLMQKVQCLRCDGVTWLPAGEVI